MEVEITLDGDRNRCPRCGCKELELRNYDMMRHDGDLHCIRCGVFIRTYDAG